MSENSVRDVAALLPDLPAVAACPPMLVREMSTGTAFREVAIACRAHIEVNIAPVIATRDAEGLHQLRIGLRRLAIMLSNFAPQADELRARAKDFFKVTGSARDLDVFLAELFEPVVAQVEPRDSFALLRSRAELARERAWNAAVACISGPAFARFLDDVENAPAAEQPFPVLTHASDALDRRLAQAKKRGRGLKTMSHEDAHRLRIALKKLRYTADFFASLYKERPVQRYLAEIKKLQDTLGALNDAAQVRATLGRLMIEEAADARVQADLSFAAGLINGWHHARAAGFKRKAHKLWRTFKQSEPFWA